jgi:hypothetical protein
MSGWLLFVALALLVYVASLLPGWLPHQFERLLGIVVAAILGSIGVLLTDTVPVGRILPAVILILGLAGLTIAFMQGLSGHPAFLLLLGLPALSGSLWSLKQLWSGPKQKDTKYPEENT